MTPEDIELVVDEADSEGACLLFEVRTPDGVLEGLGVVEVLTDRLVVRDLHIGGNAEIRWGWSKLRTIGRLIAGKLDVDHIEIHGAVRTTGANPGRRPGVVRLSRPSKP